MESVKPTDYHGMEDDTRAEKEEVKEIRGILGDPEVGGIQIKIVGDNRTMTYFRDVAGLSWNEGKLISDSKETVIVTHRGFVGPSQFGLPLDGSSIVAGDLDTIAYAEFAGKKVLLSVDGGWMNVMEPADDVPRYVLYGAEVEVGLTSTVRSLLLRNIGERGAVFHASALELEGVGGVVFSTPDLGLETKGSRFFGKTTAVLSVCIGNPNARMFANDELVIGNCSQMDARIFPNEIPVRNWLMKYLFGGNTTTDDFFKSNTVTYFTVSGLQERGVAFSPRLSGIKRWFFMDLRSDIKTSNELIKLDEEGAWEFLSNSLFLPRMLIKETAREVGEQWNLVQRQNIESLIDQDLLKTAFAALVSNGCKFYCVTGGANPTNIKLAIDKGCYEK